MTEGIFKEIISENFPKLEKTPIHTFKNLCNSQKTKMYKEHTDRYHII